MKLHITLANPAGNITALVPEREVARERRRQISAFCWTTLLWAWNKWAFMMRTRRRTCR